MNDIELIQNKIYEIRGQRVMLDRDLAELYQVTTGNLNKAVQRNIKRFPPDFMFQLTKEEWDALRFQNGIINVGRGRGCKAFAVKRGGDKKRAPFWMPFFILYQLVDD